MAPTASGPGTRASVDSASPPRPSSRIRRYQIGHQGKTPRVFYQGSPVNCQGLDRVEVQAGDAGLDVRLFTGYHPNAIACLAIAVPWGTTVTLDEPIILQDQG